MQIYSDGEVIPCYVDWRKVNVIGHISEKFIMDIWSRKKLKALQMRHLNNNKVITGLCKDFKMDVDCNFNNIGSQVDERIKRLGI